MLSLAIAAALNCAYFMLYLSSPGSFPKPLSAKEEAYYLTRFEEGDPDARNVLIERNLRLVAHIIKKYYSNSKDQEDLISIGTIGLIKAISTFNPNKGARLATYAARCIENEILMYFRSLKKSSADISISEPVDTDKDGNTISIFDIIYCEDDVAEQVDLNRNLALLQECIKTCLDKREKSILCARYGLLGESPCTQNEIAQKLKISRSYVSRIEKKALLKLREKFERR